MYIRRKLPADEGELGREVEGVFAMVKAFVPRALLSCLGKILGNYP